MFERSFKAVRSNIVAASHVWLVKLNLKLNKIKNSVP